MNGKIQPVAIGIVRKADTYLLTLRNDPDSEEGNAFVNCWQFPGGGLEYGESLEECLHREMKEEIGHDIRIVTLLPKIFSEVRGQWQGLLIPYLCELEHPDEEIVINGEASDFGWYSSEGIKDLKQLTFTYDMALLADRF